MIGIEIAINESTDETGFANTSISN